MMADKPVKQRLNPLSRRLLKASGSLLIALTTAVVHAKDTAIVHDPADMADPSGDITAMSATVVGDALQLSLTTAGFAAPTVERTTEEMTNRYYYHWLLDTDNNPATGRSNSEYEGNATNLESPIGADLVIQVGWRNGAPDGVYAYDPADDETAVTSNFAFQTAGNTITASIPLADLGLAAGQTIAVSAFQEGASDGWAVDWIESDEVTLNGYGAGYTSISDSVDDLADPSGDISGISAYVSGGNLHLGMKVESFATPAVDQTAEGMSNRYYYHWLLDTDNNPATGRSNAEYEGNATNLASPIGADLVIQVGWRNGGPDGVYAYDPADDENAVVSNFAFQGAGNSLSATIPLDALGLAAGQTIAVSGFQEGASDGWAVDWVESGTLTLDGAGAGTANVADPADMADANGDITGIGGEVVGDLLHLSMTVAGFAGPLSDQTAEGNSNRHYYHWLLDTDNNPATGRSNSEYEGNATNLGSPIGADLVVQIGWRNAAPDGVYVYDPADDETAVVSEFSFQNAGNTLEAWIPLAELGLTKGQTIALSGFQEGASDGWAVDWVESALLNLDSASGGSGAALGTASVTDPADMGDSSGDITGVSATVIGDLLQLELKVAGFATPSVDRTPEDATNRYYYHWLLDTDNNPATGRSNSEYEGNATNLASPIGADLVIQVGWRNGAPDGIYAYDPADDEVAVVSDFSYQGAGNTLKALIPLADLGIAAGQTIAFSAFQEGASNGWAVDWVESALLSIEGGNLGSGSVVDANDMLDPSGDILGMTAAVVGDHLHLTLTSEGFAAPRVDQTGEDLSNRYYYHWLIDTDNNPATGRSNSEYEGNATNLQSPIGADLVAQIGWRNGAPDGVYVYDPADDENAVVSNYSYQAAGNTLAALIPLADLGIAPGSTIAVSAFQEGASDGWAVDWIESTVLEVNGGGLGSIAIADGDDLADPSGDITGVFASATGDFLNLSLTVEGFATPTVDQTAEGMSNRYYYHWLLDTDNNPATGRSNSEYEGNATNLATPIGADLVVQVGWRNGAPDGVYVYDPADDETAIVSDFRYLGAGNTLSARIPLSDLGLSQGQTIAVSAFQEGASDGWAVDWVESALLTLSQGGGSGFEIDTNFSGNGYDFSLTLFDEGDSTVDPNSISATLNGADVDVIVSKANGITVARGIHPELLAPGSVAEVNVSANIGGSQQSKDYVINVGDYATLSLDGARGEGVEAEAGFTVSTTMISSFQTDQGEVSVHNNVAELAEQQLLGELTDPNAGFGFINETEENINDWSVTPVEVDGTINWFELAPDTETLLNFGGDEPFPTPVDLQALGVSMEGVAMEILTYLELDAGYYQFGLFSEGGHKVTSGWDPSSPVLSLFDDSDGGNRIPTYYARSQIFDIVAPQYGLYPVRILFFQSEKDNEDGFMLEFYSIRDKQLQLVNDVDNPLSIRAYRSATGEPPVPVVPVDPTLSYSIQDGQVILEWTGTLEMADDITGPWTAVEGDSPMALDTSLSSQGFVRVR